MDEIGLNSIISKSKELVASENDGEMVMMSIEKGKYYGMNQMGTQIWKHINGETKVSGVCNNLLKDTRWIIQLVKMKCRFFRIKWQKKN